MCGPDIALQASRAVLTAQRAGRFQLPARLDVDLPTGFLRVMPAAIDDHMGLKVMTLARGVGNRYLLLVYVQSTGELRAVLDADEITRLRTAATTVVAGEMLYPSGTDRLGLIGTGFEAEGHLRAFAAAWPVREVRVFSRSADRREEFARRMSKELGIDVTPATSADDAVGDVPVTLLCTKSTAPVVDGRSFPSGAVVLSIGSTRLDLRELDDITLRRARVLLVDDPAQVTAESGDVSAGLASGALPADRVVGMSEWTDQGTNGSGDRNLSVFKSVGTALHDLALASVAIEEATRRGLGVDLGELCSLKPSAPGAVVPSAVVAQAVRDIEESEGVSP
ncbi:ornithine cyclodeaminase family protein [Streptomyces sp. NPDC057199]|uniref:ornithine cyclodeaminase family protein n=1 Tax=Streptomyces sp. NPDC057199 TaxID=3346047 RepID=UPI00363906E4